VTVVHVTDTDFTRLPVATAAGPEVITLGAPLILG
jgi:hypothetical protein